MGKNKITESMKTVLYSRVSTSEQDAEVQLIELRSVAKQRGWSVVAEYSDVISGSARDRPALDAMLSVVKAGGIDAVVAVKLDRIGRSMSNFCQVSEILRKNGCGIICTSQGIDTTKGNACGELLQNLLMSIAQFEKTLIQERTKAGLAAARARGKVLGRPSTKMPDEAGRILIVDTWRGEGLPGGYDELGRRLGGVSRATAMRVAKRVTEVVEEGP